MQYSRAFPNHTETEPFWKRFSYKENYWKFTKHCVTAFVFLSSTILSLFVGISIRKIRPSAGSKCPHSRCRFARPQINSGSSASKSASVSIPMCLCIYCRKFKLSIRAERQISIVRQRVQRSMPSTGCTMANRCRRIMHSPPGGISKYSPGITQKLGLQVGLGLGPRRKNGNGERDSLPWIVRNRNNRLTGRHATLFNRFRFLSVTPVVNFPAKPTERQKKNI